MAARLLTIPYCPHTPTAKQSEFLLDFGLEALYGGAAGGGKSDALLMGALQFVEIPNYAALILRKTFADLNQPGALMDRARAWLGGTDARWVEKRHAWVFPSGAILQFGYLEHEKQKYRYQSAEFQFIAFDELTQFSETQYRFLFSRLRRPKIESTDTADVRRLKEALSRVPLRMRGATNPGGEGHQWVRARFIDSTRQGTRFHAASLKDNPFLDEESYRESLLMLDRVTRGQMLEGNWDIREQGGYFDRSWFMEDTHVREELPPQHLVKRRVRFWDLASTDESMADDPDYTAGCRMALLKNGRLVIEDMRRARRSPAGVEDLIKSTAESDPAGTEIFIEQEPGASGKSVISYYRRHVLARFPVRGFPRTQSKEEYARAPSARAEQGDMDIVRGNWWTQFFDEIEAFPKTEHKDQTDAFTGAFAVLWKDSAKSGTIGVPEVLEKVSPWTV